MNISVYYQGQQAHQTRIDDPTTQTNRYAQHITTNFDLKKTKKTKRKRQKNTGGERESKTKKNKKTE